jgi:hypothetical protein
MVTDISSGGWDMRVTRNGELSEGMAGDLHGLAFMKIVMQPTEPGALGSRKDCSQLVA